MKKIVSLLCFMLTLAFVQPLTPSASDNIVYTYEGLPYYGPMLSAKGDLFLGDPQPVYEKEFSISDYQLIRISPDGSKLTLNLAHGVHEYIEYNGSIYSLFLNYATKELEVYDENFKQIDKVAVDFQDDFAIPHVQYEHYVNFYTYVDLGEDKGHKRVNIVYDLKEKKLASSISAPIVETEFQFKSNGNHVIDLKNALGITVNTVPLKGLTHFEITDSYYMDGYLYAILQNEHYQGTHLVKLDLDGNVLAKHALPILANSISAVILEDKIRFAVYDYTVDDGKTTLFDYQIATDSIEVIKENLPPSIKVETLNDEFYVETNRSELFTIKDHQNHTRFTIQQEGEIVDVNEKYLIFTAYNSNQNTHQIREIATGKIIKEIDSELVKFARFINNDYFYTIASPILGDYNEETVEIFAIDGTPTLQSTGYAPNKAWTILLSQEVNPTTVNKDNIYVTDAAGTKIPVTFETNGSKVIVKAPTAGYAKGNYTLHVEASLQSQGGQSLTKATTKAFQIK